VTIPAEDGGTLLTQLSTVATAITSTGVLDDLTVTGAVIANGAVTLGNEATDVVTVTGKIAGTNALKFDGSTVDTHYLTLAVADASAGGATVTIPAEDGGTLLTQLSTVATGITGVGTLSTVTVSGQSNMGLIKFAKTSITAATNMAIDMNAGTSFVEVAAGNAADTNTLTINNPAEGQILLLKNLEQPLLLWIMLVLIISHNQKTKVLP
jgi:hypothetical protein